MSNQIQDLKKKRDELSEEVSLLERELAHSEKEYLKNNLSREKQREE